MLSERRQFQRSYIYSIYLSSGRERPSVTENRLVTGHKRNAIHGDRTGLCPDCEMAT